jgi:DNA polymerase alpha-associated DNA helicase A
MTKVVNHLLSKLEKNTLSSVEKVLLNMQAPRFSNTVKDDNLELFDSSLNPSQIEAIKLALNAEELALIHGPPGVNKSELSNLLANINYLIL